MPTSPDIAITKSPQTPESDAENSQAPGPHRQGLRHQGLHRPKLSDAHARGMQPPEYSPGYSSGHSPGHASGHSPARSPAQPPEHSPESSSQPGKPLLSNNYYLENFCYLVKFVFEHYESLLTLDERHFCNSFFTLSVNAQQLFVRLALRTPTNIRLSKINYPEIDKPAGIDELINNEFIELDNCSIEQCLPLYSLAELRHALGSPVTESKNVNATVWNTPDLFGDTPLAKLCSNDNIVNVHYKETITLLRLLFFGNLYQDFSDFVLRDLGLQRYEMYAIDGNTLLFKSRTQIDAHLGYYECAEYFEEACTIGAPALIELHTQLPLKIPSDKALCRRVDKLNNKIARQLEREDELTAAREIYTSTTLPPARERLARINAKTDQQKLSLDICKDILAAPHDCNELDFAATFGQKLAKKLNKDFPLCEKYTPPESLLTLTKSKLSVEFSVALHFAKTGKCYYLENNLLSTVFGLVFWDIIFAPVDGAFFHPFQSAPADFYDAAFTESRQSLIDARLAEILNGELRHYVFTHAYQKRGIRNPMVNWVMCRKHVLNLAVNRIPLADWHAIFRLILTDIKHYKSGQPDLVYFPDAGGYQLLEVKAPGDQLQKNQLRWMKWFNQHNISHGVMHVEWIEPNDH